MKVVCEYCGTHFNTLKHTSCPSCGASLEGNDQLQDELARQRQIDQLNVRDIENRIERERLENEAEKQRQKSGYYHVQEHHDFQPAKRRRTFMWLWVMFPIIFIAVTIFIVSIMNTVRSSMDSAKDFMEDIISTTIETEPPHKEAYAEFGEKADTGKIAITCTKFEEYYYPWTKPEAGYKYVRLYLVVENTYDKEINAGADFVCSYEDETGTKIQANVPTIDSRDLGTKIRGGTIKPGLAITGWVYYTVPENADLILQWGTKVTIDIDAEHCANLPE